MDTNINSSAWFPYPWGTAKFRSCRSHGISQIISCEAQSRRVSSVLKLRVKSSTHGHFAASVGTAGTRVLCRYSTASPVHRDFSGSPCTERRTLSFGDETAGREAAYGCRSSAQHETFPVRIVSCLEGHSSPFSFPLLLKFQHCPRAYGQSKLMSVMSALNHLHYAPLYW
jgi:hypothetical protein